MAKTWKSDGPEQKYLEKLFRDKQVKCDMKPAAVQKAYPLFHGFSAMVFRKHWALTKQLFDETFDPPSVYDLEQSSNSNYLGIPDFDGVMAQRQVQPEKKTKLTSPEVQNEVAIIPSQFIHAPVLPCLYTDPDTKQEKCLVVVLLFNGVTEITFNLIESIDGEPTLKVNYEWPKEMFDTKSMFKKDNEQTMFVSQLHPKVLAVEKTLQKIRTHMDDAPIGFIEIKLPVKLQMDPGTWSQTFNEKDNGNIVVYFEFFCIRQEYTIKKTEKTLRFV